MNSFSLNSIARTFHDNSFLSFCFSSQIYARNMLTCGKVSIEMFTWKVSLKKVMKNKEIEFIASRRIEFISKRRLHIASRMDIGVQQCWIIKKIRFSAPSHIHRYFLFIHSLDFSNNVLCVWFSFNGVYVNPHQPHIANIFSPKHRIIFTLPLLFMFFQHV